MVACRTESPPTTSPESQATSSSQPEIIEAGLDEAFTLTVGQSIKITETDIAISFEGVERDGRCPAAVICAEDGPVIIVVSATEGESQPTSFTMNPDPQLARLEGIPPNTFSFEGYEIELTAVEPYPEQPEDILYFPYTATLIVHSE